ncbi:hypothetical protein J2T13_005075 [Paenibacillus sp. DS2015]|uniref:hypothetical protein n=1 Tax=Paenibacillus sp. DS2015 TaxID=3373917 RepID=UPI003D242627
MNSMRRYILVALLILLIPCLTGCWGNKQIEDQSLYVGLALDVAEESEVEKELSMLGDDYPKKNLITSTIQIIPLQKSQESPSASKSTSTMYLNNRKPVIRSFN